MTSPDKLAEETEKWEKAVAEGNPDQIKEPIPLATRNKAARDAWNEEDASFRDAFVEEMDTEHQEAKEHFLNRTSHPSTPEEYHKYVFPLSSLALWVHLLIRF